MTAPSPRTAAQAQEDMLAVLPSGFAAPPDRDRYAAARFAGLADAFANAETAGLGLLPQLIDPRGAGAMLPEWAAEMDLAAWLGDLAQYSEATQRDVAFALLTQGVPVCAGDWERFALLIGETVTVQEFPPSLWGGFTWGAVTFNPPPGDRQVVVNAGSVAVTEWVWGDAAWGNRFGAFEPGKIASIMAGEVAADIQLIFAYEAI